MNKRRKASIEQRRRTNFAQGELQLLRHFRNNPDALPDGSWMYLAWRMGFDAGKREARKTRREQ